MEVHSSLTDDKYRGTGGFVSCFVSFQSISLYHSIRLIDSYDVDGCRECPFNVQY